MEAKNQELVALILKPTTSTKKRKMYATQLFMNSKISPIILDKCLDYAICKRHSTEKFLSNLDLVTQKLEEAIPQFLSDLENRLLDDVNKALIEFYLNFEEGDMSFGKRLQVLRDEGKLVFEFPYESHRVWPDKLTKTVRDKNNWDLDFKYDFRNLLKNAYALVMYHATSTVFDDAIAREGLNPPTKTGLDIISLYEAYQSKHLLETTAHKRLIQSVKVHRQNSVYFSINAKPEGRNVGLLFSNGDVHSYLERAVEMYGGTKRLYRCIVPTNIMLPDEDANNARDYVDSIHWMGSAKVNGGFNGDIFQAKDDKFFIRDDSVSKLLQNFKSIIFSTKTLQAAYFSQNPIESLFN